MSSKLSIPEHPSILSDFPFPDLREKRFVCRCCGVNHVDIRLQQYIKELEAYIGRALLVTSGYRCKEYNDRVGGSRTSSHLGGLAADIACRSDRLRFEIIHNAIKLGITRIGVYRNFIHLDIDKGKTPEVIWHA